MKIIDINGVARDCTSVAIDSNFPGYMKVEFLSKIRKGYKHSEWYPIPQFVKNNPSLKQLAQGAAKIPNDDLGVVTEAKPRQLIDRTKKWEANIYAGYPIWIARGKGEGQTRFILSNNKNSLKIDKDWETLPNKTSQYVISYNVHDPQVLGNTLPEGVLDPKKFSRASNPKPKNKKKRLN